MPLWTIFTKWPAPSGRSASSPARPGSARRCGRACAARRRRPGAIVAKIGSSASTTSVLAADHQAEAALEPQDAAAGADVDVVDALLRERLPRADVVAVVGVAAVDHDVAGLEQLGERVDRPSVMSPAGTISHTARGFASFATKSASDAHRSAPSSSSAVTASVDVGHDALVAVAQQPADHVGAHPAEADHSELHGRLRDHRSPLQGVSPRRRLETACPKRGSRGLLVEHPVTADDPHRSWISSSEWLFLASLVRVGRNVTRARSPVIPKITGTSAAAAPGSPECRPGGALDLDPATPDRPTGYPYALESAASGPARRVAFAAENSLSVSTPCA